METRLNVVISQSGGPIQGATVTVYSDDALTTVADIFEQDGLTPKANPFQTNSEGEYRYAAANGRYAERVTYGAATKDIIGIIFYDPADEAGTASVTLETLLRSVFDRCTTSYPRQQFNNAVQGMAEQSLSGPAFMIDEKNIFSMRNGLVGLSMAFSGNELSDPATTSLRAIGLFDSEDDVLVVGTADTAGVAIISEDGGASWTEEAIGGANELLSSVVRLGSTYIIGSYNGRAFTAADSDLSSWTLRTVEASPPGTTDWYVKRLAQDGTTVVAGIYDESETDAVVYTSTDGTTWTRRVVISSGTADCQALLHNGTAFYYFQGGLVYRSVDGVTWDAVTHVANAVSLFTENISAATDGSGNLVLVNGGEFITAYYSEGDTAFRIGTHRSDPDLFTNLLCGPVTYIADDDYYKTYVRSGHLAGRALYSVDGVEWEFDYYDYEKNISFGISRGVLNSDAGNPSTVLLLGSPLLYLGSTSSTGRTAFTVAGLPVGVSAGVGDAVWDGAQYVLVGTKSGNIAVWLLPDYTAQSPYVTDPTTVPATAGSLNSVAFDGIDTYVAVGSNLIFRSTDAGDTWASVTPPVSFVGTHIEYANGQFVVAGTTGNVFTSTDGVTWLTRNVGASVSLQRVAFSTGNTWMAMAALSNQLYVSSDNAVSWSPVPFSSPVTQIKSLFYISEFNRWFVIGAASILASENDGASWTSFPITYGQHGGVMNNQGGLYVANSRYIYLFGNGKCLFTGNF